MSQLLAKGREWVEARTAQIAGELGLREVQGRWINESESIYQLRVGSRQQNCIFSPAWLVYCSSEVSEPLRGLIVNEIRDKMRALKRGLDLDQDTTS
ncbi:MAG TPA: hypothetical protein PLP42_08240 [Acidobacteriota bacterium]|nr:hypothetical protein [Acidobacteriota bacterium]